MLELFLKTKIYRLKIQTIILCEITFRKRHSKSFMKLRCQIHFEFSSVFLRYFKRILSMFSRVLTRVMSTNLKVIWKVFLMETATLDKITIRSKLAFCTSIYFKDTRISKKLFVMPMSWRLSSNACGQFFFISLTLILILTAWCVFSSFCDT